MERERERVRARETDGERVGEVEESVCFMLQEL